MSWWHWLIMAMAIGPVLLALGLVALVLYKRRPPQLFDD